MERRICDCVGSHSELLAKLIPMRLGDSARSPRKDAARGERTQARHPAGVPTRTPQLYIRSGTMSDRVEDLARAFERFPGIGPRQARRFVYHLLALPLSDRTRIADLVSKLAENMRQCPECMRYANGSGPVCNYCADSSRDDSILLIVEKDQDLLALERAGMYKGRYFVLGGVLTLSGKGTIREKELMRAVDKRMKNGLKEIILALSATSEGENTADHLQQILLPYRETGKITELGRGLATGSELEYSDAETLSGALQNRKET